jgi:hypothetical protein
MLAAFILAAIAFGGLNAAAASAEINCSPYGTNYYGEACLSGSFNGISGTIASEALSHGSDYFVDNDMWIVHSASEPHWIEAGLINGLVCLEHSESGSCLKEEWSEGVRFFWGDDRSGSSEYSHLGGLASLGTGYGDKIYFKGSETWSVEVGSFSGSSTKNPLSANLIRTGTEESEHDGATACSEQYNLEWLEPSTNKWHSGWSDAENASLKEYNYPNVWWVTTNHWVRDRSNTTCYGS